MKEKAIVMSTESVLAILAGRKTQTRRVIKPQPDENGCFDLVSNTGEVTKAHYSQLLNLAPYQPGNILYVKETFCAFVHEHILNNDAYAYKADSTPDSERARNDYVKCGYPYRWHSPMFMPRAAARIFLRVVSVRIERIQDISEADAIAEGVPQHEGEGIPAIYCRACKGTGFVIMPVNGGASESDCPNCDTAVKRYHNLWDFLNGKRNHGAYAWEKNPWVYAYGLERMDGYGR
jgi:hypothetical protein